MYAATLKGVKKLRIFEGIVRHSIGKKSKLLKLMIILTHLHTHMYKYYNVRTAGMQEEFNSSRDEEGDSSIEEG